MSTVGKKLIVFLCSLSDADGLLLLFVSCCHSCGAILSCAPLLILEPVSLDVTLSTIHIGSVGFYFPAIPFQPVSLPCCLIWLASLIGATDGGHILTSL